MIFWGLAVLLLVNYVYPYLSKLIESIPIKLGNIIFNFFIIFMSLNMIISWTALARLTLRNKGNPPLTFIGEFYDKVYTDARLKKIYTNMKFVE